MISTKEEEKFVFNTAKEILLKWLERNPTSIEDVGDSFKPLIKKVKEGFESISQS